jgi:ABC-2 type transport system permease protein
MLWMYLTPVLYSISLIPENFLGILNLNPMFHVIVAYRDIFYSKVMPNMTNLGILFGVSIVLLFISYAIFKKLEKRFAEEL